MTAPVDAKDRSTWHSLCVRRAHLNTLSRGSTVRIPLPTPRQAEIVKEVIEVDRELKAHLVSRTLALEGSELVACVALHDSLAVASNRPCLLLARTEIYHAQLADLAHSTFACLTIRQARVSLDHFLSDVGLVIETIETFSPPTEAIAG